MNIRRFIPQIFKKNISTLIYNIPLRLRILRPSPYRAVTRYSYQKELIDFGLSEDDHVLDIGSGAYPFPYATLLVDRFLEPTQHRSQALERGGKPLIIADILNLPFTDKEFDFVYCSHLLEHVDDPIQACCELMRVGRRGYIETPTLTKDSLFAWAKGMHKWHVMLIANNLCFFEYNPRQLEGVRSNFFRNLVLQKWYHPLQDMVYNNHDVFNIMFKWDDQFSVFVFYLDGSIRQFNAPSTPPSTLPAAADTHRPPLGHNRGAGGG